MTIVIDHLTNGAYGFGPGKVRRVKPVALACVHVTGNSKTAAMTDLHAAARAERHYAGRVGSRGPSAHLYAARDGWAIEAIARGYAAWSNGDVSRPNTANPGIRRVLALRAKGYNANEAYWDEIECVGWGSKFPITAAQKATIGARIAANAKLSGLPINRETVHGHWEINGVDRQNCPGAPAAHEAFLRDIIARANAILHPPATYTVHIAPRAKVRSYALGAGGCLVMPGIDKTWGATASQARASASRRRTVCGGGSTVTTTLVTSGAFRGRQVRVGAVYGVTLTRENA